MSIKEQLKPLVWQSFYEIDVSITPLYEYQVTLDEKTGKYQVKYITLDINETAENEPATGFKTEEQAKDWAFEHHCEKMAKWIKQIDPFATLHFYRHPLLDGDLIAHGKAIEYRLLNLGNPEKIRVIINTLSNDKRKEPKDLKTLEQAQAWCQADYDKYYKELSDD